MTEDRVLFEHRDDITDDSMEVIALTSKELLIRAAYDSGFATVEALLSKKEALKLAESIMKACGDGESFVFIGEFKRAEPMLFRLKGDD